MTKCIKKTDATGSEYNEVVVSRSAQTKAKEVLAKAEEMGWSRELILNTKGALPYPYGNQYGLVCFLGDDPKNGVKSEVGEITEKYIEIISTQKSGGRVSQHFYRPD